MDRKAFLLGVAVACAFSATTDAQPEYDVALERAVMEIVSRKIGDMRPGFGYGQVPKILTHTTQFGVGDSRPLSSYQVPAADPVTRLRGSEYLPDLRLTIEDPRPISAIAVSRVVYH